MDKEALAKAAGAALASGALGRTSLPILLFSCCTFVLCCLLMGLPKMVALVCTLHKQEIFSDQLPRLIISIKGDKGKTAAAALGMSGFSDHNCEVFYHHLQVAVMVPELEQHLVLLELLLAIIMVAPATRRRRKTRGLLRRRRRRRTRKGQGQRRGRRRRRKEAGRREALRAALAQTLTRSWYPGVFF